jgi:phospholipid/cholesterol/gamma-HCH transport system ATP-binding protein
MRTRAAIARAMALEPTLLFLDEPTAGLDPTTAADFDNLLVVLNRALGLTVVLVTHDLATILRIASRCLMVDRASRSIIAVGDPHALRDESADARVRRFFHPSTEEAAP